MMASAGVVGRLRLAAGLTLFTYVTLHLLNHALGLVSLAAMEAGRWWFVLLWRNPIGTTLLYGALLTHFTLVLVAIWQRRTLRISAGEVFRLCLGLSIPLLVISHIVANRVAYSLFDVDAPYAKVVFALWNLRPDYGLRQAVLVLVAWTHGIFGLHFWLRFRPWYPRFAPWLVATGVLVPVLALLGFAQAGRETRLLAAQPGWASRLPWPSPAQRGVLEEITDASFWALVAIIAIVLGGRLLRNAWERRRRGLVPVRYADLGRTIRVAAGTSVLEASRLAGIPHASVCGGRARCSTCRVRIAAGRDALPPPNDAEADLLHRVGAPPNVRLACQLRPLRGVSVVRLLPPTVRVAPTLMDPAPLAGQEQEVTVFFADLRGFTRFAEHRLPYDVVFFLNRYFEAVGHAIQEHGGIPNQFTGDGVMAIFGVGLPVSEGCRQALAAARAAVHALARLSEALAGELDEPLRLGIGLHVGPAVVGEMGYASTRYLTAVGDTVHVASRLQDLTKDYHCHLVMSEHVAIAAGVDVDTFPRHEITVRNRREPLVVRVVDDVHRLTNPEGDEIPWPTASTTST